MDVPVLSICVREEDFTPDEAAELLRSSCGVSLPPYKPKAGEAYLFRPDAIRCASKFPGI